MRWSRSIVVGSGLAVVVIVVLGSALTRGLAAAAAGRQLGQAEATERLLQARLAGWREGADASRKHWERETESLRAILGWGGGADTGPVDIPQRIESQARLSGVVCDAIGEVSEPTNAYRATGSGGPTGITRFLTRLESDPALSNLVRVRIWTDERGVLRFDVFVVTPPDQDGGG